MVQCTQEFHCVKGLRKRPQPLFGILQVGLPAFFPRNTGLSSQCFITIFSIIVQYMYNTYVYTYSVILILCEINICIIELIHMGYVVLNIFNQLMEDKEEIKGENDTTVVCNESQKPKQHQSQWKRNKNLHEPCALCGKAITKNNMAAHIKTHNKSHGKEIVTKHLERRANIHKEVRNIQRMVAVGLLDHKDLERPENFFIPPSKKVPANVSMDTEKNPEPKLKDANNSIKSNLPLANTNKEACNFPQQSTNSIPVAEPMIIDKNVETLHKKTYPIAEELVNGLSFADVQKFYVPVSKTIEGFLDLLNPIEREQHLTKRYPWGPTEPTEGMWRYLKHLKDGFNDLSVKYNILFEELELVRSQLDEANSEKNLLKERLTFGQLAYDKFDRFFNTLATKEDAWKVLDKAISKVHSTHEGVGAFAKWHEEAEQEFKRYSADKESNYWKKMYAQSIASSNRHSMEYIANTAELSRLKTEFLKVKKELDTLKLRLDLAPESFAAQYLKLFNEKDELGKELKELKLNLDATKTKLESKESKIAKFKDRLHSKKMEYRKETKRLLKIIHDQDEELEMWQGQ
eukprot:TRINITY_DN1623_c1_g1_i4.p2 TRINITY_DN1623_c1_g1~~TRINITY_DN1623_c1_g1_i4.p2  ORF type:complete len:574 (+),score=39.57 TRINITY_DN1623_c1_g1_i4:5350-7071(+)